MNIFFFLYSFVYAVIETASPCGYFLIPINGDEEVPCRTFRIGLFGTVYLVAVPLALIDDFRGAYIGQERAAFSVLHPETDSTPLVLLFDGYYD